jgi:hypothetical protein
MIYSWSMFFKACLSPWLRARFEVAGFRNSLGLIALPKVFYGLHVYAVITRPVDKQTTIWSRCF